MEEKLEIEEEEDLLSSNSTEDSKNHFINLEGSFQDDELFKISSINEGTDSLLENYPQLILEKLKLVDHVNSNDRNINYNIGSNYDGCGSRGDRLASMTGSILNEILAYKDSSSSIQSFNEDGSMDMSICKSEILFSPFDENEENLSTKKSILFINKENGSNTRKGIEIGTGQIGTFSTDSLDVRTTDLLANCTQPNANTYTIAFNGNLTIEDNEIDESLFKPINPNRKEYYNKLYGNNNGSSNSSSSQFSVDCVSHLLTQSCPSHKNNIYETKPLIFDLRNQNPIKESTNIQTWKHEINGHKRVANVTQAILRKSIEIQTSNPSLDLLKDESSTRSTQLKSLVICYPNYTLPDLEFLRSTSEKNQCKKDINSPTTDIIFLPQSFNSKSSLKSEKDTCSINEKSSINIIKRSKNEKIISEGYKRAQRPLSCNDIQELRKRDLKAIKDWPSLQFLLPETYKELLKDIFPTSLSNYYNYNQNNIERKPLFRQQYKNDTGKRFSLQEHVIPELNELTNEINKNLTVIEDDHLFEYLIDHTEKEQIPISKKHEYENYSNEQNKLIELIDRVVEKVEHSVIKRKSRISGAHLLIVSESEGGQIISKTLFPTLYSLLSDGLCSHLETIFGRISNTVWCVVESCMQYGPTPQPLSQLLLRINSEEILSEGPLKFNAFLSGLLNLGCLSTWLTFLRTKERLLKTHYNTDSLMFLCNTTKRELYDALILSLQKLSKLPFQLDIFYEAKILHRKMFSYETKKESNGSSTKKISSSKKGHSGSVKNMIESPYRMDSTKLIEKGYSQSKNSKFYTNQLRKTQMKRSYSDERPGNGKIVTLGNSEKNIPKSKTSQNLNIITINTRYPNPDFHHDQTVIGGGYGRNGRDPHSALINHSTDTQVKLRKHSTHKDNTCTNEHSSKRTAQRPKSLGYYLEGSKDHGQEKNPEKFNNLRLQWELLSGNTEDGNYKGNNPITAGNVKTSSSKIPRPISSPLKSNHPFLQQQNPFLYNNQQKISKR